MRLIMFFTCLVLKLGKIFQDSETKALAFFGMKLKRMNIFVMNARGEFDPVTGCGGDDCRVLRNDIIGVHKIKIRLIIHRV